MISIIEDDSRSYVIGLTFELTLTTNKRLTQEEIDFISIYLIPSGSPFEFMENLSTHHGPEFSYASINEFDYSSDEEIGDTVTFGPNSLEITV